MDRSSAYDLRTKISYSNYALIAVGFIKLSNTHFLFKRDFYLLGVQERRILRVKV